MVATDGSSTVWSGAPYSAQDRVMLLSAVDGELFNMRCTCTTWLAQLLAGR